MRYVYNRLSSLLLLIMFLGSNAIAGSLDYTTYYVSTYAPSLENPYYDNVTGYNSDGSNSSPNGLGSVLSTGTISTISGFDWGSGQVLDSGRSDNVAVKVTGYITESFLEEREPPIEELLELESAVSEMQQEMNALRPMNLGD